MGFGEKLQRMRKEKGLSQEALAEMLGVSRQAISKWESGGSYPEMSHLITLSEIFGVTLDSLVKDGEVREDGNNTMAVPFWVTRGRVYEYKSEKTLWGLPLVHVHIGFGMKKAKGIVAIGNVATGVVSVGLLAKGGVAIGCLSMGLVGMGCLTLGLLLAIGAIAVGTFSIGAIAIGVFALGAVAIGMFSTGALAVASHVAIGDHAYGHIAVGRVVRGVKTFVDNSPGGYAFSDINAKEVRDAILESYPYLWRWVVNLATWILG